MSELRKRMLALAAVLLLAGSAAAQGRVECSSVKSAAMRGKVRYCVMLPPGYDAARSRNFPVLYHLHGLGMDESALVNMGGWSLLEELQHTRRVGDFIVVTPDGGSSFYINARSGKADYEDFFIREFIPAIEKKYRISARRAHRGISGISMGGYGALRFAFKYPQLFGSVSAHSAALLERFPREMAMVAENRGRRAGGPLGAVFGSPPDAAFYEQNNPFTLVRQKKSFPGLKIYFDCGDRDEFGFHRGNRALARLLAERKIEHEAHIYPGGHNWRYFAAHMDESLEFHSRAFSAR